jgi:hypothetical protein
METQSTFRFALDSELRKAHALAEAAVREDFEAGRSGTVYFCLYRYLINDKYCVGTVMAADGGPLVESLTEVLMRQREVIPFFEEALLKAKEADLDPFGF